MVSAGRIKRVQCKTQWVWRNFQWVWRSFQWVWRKIHWIWRRIQWIQRGIQWVQGPLAARAAGSGTGVPVDLFASS